MLRSSSLGVYGLRRRPWLGSTAGALLAALLSFSATIGLSCKGGTEGEAGRSGLDGEGARFTGAIGAGPDSDSGERFSVALPAGWQADSAVREVGEVAFLGPGDAELQPRFSIRVSPASEASPEAQRRALRNALSLLAHCKVLSDETTTMAGVPAIDLRAECSTAEVRLMNRLVCATIRDRQYLLTFVCPAAEYERLRQACDRLIATFRIEDESEDT